MNKAHLWGQSEHNVRYKHFIFTHGLEVLLAAFVTNFILQSSLDPKITMLSCLYYLYNPLRSVCYSYNPV